MTTKTAADPDGAGALTSPVTTYAYDAASHLVTETDPRGNATTYAYDAIGRVTSVTQPDPDGGGALTSPVTSYVYDALGQVTKVTDPLGNYTQYAYNANRALTTITEMDPDGAGSQTSPVTTYAYDGIGRVTSVTDSLSHVTSYAYDAASRVTTITDPLSHVTTTAYDNLGRTTSVTRPDPDGAGGLLAPVTSYTYDAASRLTTVTAPDPDGAGGLSSPVTTYAYDNLNRQTSVTDPLSHATSYQYDAAGNVTRVTDALSNYTQFAYDAANRLTTVTEMDPDGAGGLTSPVTSYAYDRIGRLLTVTDPRSGVTTYAYDANSNLASLDDPGGNTTTYAYDTLNRLTGETNELSATRSYGYDAASNLTSQTDRNGRVTNFTYDGLNRLTAELWKSGGSTIRTLSYSYDAVGKLLSAGDADSAFAYTYDAANRLTQVDNNGTPSVPRVILTVGYDNLDRRTSLSATVAGTADFLNGYSYDALGRMTQVTQQGQSGGNTVAAKRVDLSYNAAGNFAGISRYANLAGTQLVASTTYGYDNDNRLTSLSHDKGGTNLASYTWSFDNAGRLTATTNADGSTSYTYDAASQLTAADHSYQTDEAYSYDANGNRTTSGYSTGTNNRVTSDGTYNYTYDSEGNRTRKTTISGGAYVDYTWDYHNRLTDVTFKTSGGTTTKKVHYTYDVFDRLLGKQVDSNGDGTYDSAQWFVSDGDDTILAYDGAGSLTNRYLTGPVIDQVFADERASGALYWSLADNLGTVRDVAQYNSGTNTTTVVNHIKYDSFGQITAQSDSTKQPLFAYTGRQWDSDTSLQYSRARWYDPRIGRFLSEDPLSFAAGDVNLTRYVANSPVRFTDPSGKRSEMINANDGSALALNSITDRDAFTLIFSMTVGTEDGNDGYSNDLMRLFGEEVVRPIIGDDRLVKPGGLKDDALLALRLATEATSYIDPTPMSDLLNAVTYFVDGENGQGALILAGAIVPGAFDKIAKRLPLDKIVAKVGGGPTNAFAKLGKNADDAGDFVKRTEEATKKMQDQMKKNRESGKAFEHELAEKMHKEQKELASQVTLKTKEGVETTMDFIEIDPSARVPINLIEAKGSLTARLTKNQKIAHPQIAAGGAVVVGAGKPGCPGGTIIPPMPVTVVRPPLKGPTK